jgi:hypothetical protein
MNALADILDRRARLLAEAEVQRESLAENLAVCRSVLIVADRGIAWAKWLRARPYLVVAVATAFAALRPRRALVWSARAIALWRLGSVLYNLIAPALAGRRDSKAISVEGDRT